jgi:hypothetical protein
LPDRTIGVQATPRPAARRARPSAARRAFAVALVLCLLAIVGAPIHGAAPTANAATLRAVVIVGPSGASTSFFLDIGAQIARQAEAAGMDVRRVFHPRATDNRVLQNIQGASLVVYLGHGNGWPSPYAPFQERTKNGFGLNPYEGSSAKDHVYRGANWIRANVRLASHAVVMLIGACYASGNGEPGMKIPSLDIAKQRVDNFADGFLYSGAGAVYAFGWQQRADYPQMLMSSSKTVDEIFMTRASGSPNGWIGWNDRYLSSERTPGARIHLDPHSSYGYYRAVSGDLGMTANEFRGAGGSASSVPAGDTSAPSAPTGLNGTSDATRKVALTWNASTDNGGGDLRYRVFRNGNRIATVSATSFSQTLSSDGSYRYQVAAVDGAGNVSARSTALELLVAAGDSSSSTVTTLTAPRHLASESLGYRKVRLTWWKPTEIGAGGLRYAVFRNGVKIARVSSQEYVDQPDRAGTNSYKVRAIDSAGQKSAFTNSVDGVALKGAVY